MSNPKSKIFSQRKLTIAECIQLGAIVPRQHCYKRGDKYCSSCGYAIAKEYAIDGRFCPICHLLVRHEALSNMSRRKRQLELEKKRY